MRESGNERGLDGFGIKTLGIAALGQRPILALRSTGGNLFFNFKAKSSPGHHRAHLHFCRKGH